MSTLSRFSAVDLFKFNNINLDPLTETYSISSYLQYMAEYPDYFYKISNNSGQMCGYLMSKHEGIPSIPINKIESLYHGFLYLTRHVTAITVAPEYRRLGIAKKFMDILEFMSEEYKCFFVDLFVRKSNIIAIQMYKSLGYSVYRTVIDYYTGNDGEDAYDMRKALSHDLLGITVVPLKHAITSDQLEW